MLFRSGYPVLPALYMAGASAIMLILLLYRTETSWPGLVIVLTGIPVYYLWRGRSATSSGTMGGTRG